MDQALPVDDVIIAPITATGGAVALVRLSGAGSWELARKVFAPLPSAPRTSTYGRLAYRSRSLGPVGDDGLATLFAEGHSYTGEESVELSVHGSPASVRLLVETCVELGARPAKPGEFTLRAFMNGRLDLTQAEGVAASVEALSDAQLRQGELLRQGKLKSRVQHVRDSVVEVLAAVEAATDFEEETGPLDRAKWAGRLEGLEATLCGLCQDAEAGRLVREGVTVVLLGLPNAGKSSLFNALCGSDRAIVTPHPGTTRDLVEAEVQLGGNLFRLIDTAGLREASDDAETMGVERSRHSASNADVVVYCFDGTVGWTTRDADECPDGALKVTTKSDLATPPAGYLAVSATTGAGVERLRVELAHGCGGSESGLVLPRHAPLLGAACGSLAKARATLDSTHLPSDLAAVHLQASLRSLGEVTGETATPDMLDEIFSRFCVGK